MNDSGPSLAGWILAGAHPDISRAGTLDSFPLQINLTSQAGANCKVLP
jgi:hypothetical protein